MLQVTDTLAGVAIFIVSIIILTILTKKIPVLIESVWIKWPKNLALLRHILKLIEFIFRSIFFFLKDFEIMYYLLFAGTTFMGVYVHKFWFSITLTEITNR